MTDDLRCRWMGSEHPRAIIGRHDESCTDEDCRGCEPCTRAHCRCCGIEHATGVCAGCVGAVRQDLDAIVEMTDQLPAEVEHRGVDSEAMNLLGPTADPEARGHLRASVAVGRVPAEYLEDGAETPLWTIGTWAMVYRDAFEHDAPTAVVVLATEAGYLGRNLTFAADLPDVPFEEFARELRQCRGHLESVLGDSNRGERTNIDCLDCRSTLERRLGPQGFDDVATCRGCKRRYTAPEYGFAVRSHYIENAEWLSDGDMALRTGVKADTVRSWARTPKDDSPPLVSKKLEQGRVVFNVEDVQRVARDKGLAA